MKKQLKSFWHAFCGVLYAFKTEAHLRFHIVAATFVLIFAAICAFSAERFAVLLAFIGMIIALECVNTAIEYTCDAFTKDYHPLIKLAKDLAAAAVLVAAIAAAAVAAIFFLNADSLGKIAAFFTAYPLSLIPLGVLAAAAALFVLFGGKKSK